MDFDDEFGELPPDDNNEERLFALLNNAEKQQEQVTALLDRMGKVIDTVEAGQGKIDDYIGAVDSSFSNVVDSFAQGVASLELSQSRFDKLVMDGASNAIVGRLGDTFESSVVEKINSVSAGLVQSANAQIEVGKDNAKNVADFREFVLEAKSGVFDKLENRLIEVGSNAVVKGTEKGVDEIKSTMKWSFDKLAQWAEYVDVATNSFEVIVERAERAKNSVKNYYDEVIMKRHYQMFLGLGVGWALVCAIASVVVYKSVVPDGQEIAERVKLAQQTEFRLQLAQQAMSAMPTMADDKGNIYLRVSRGDCRDFNNQNYCLRK